MRRKDRPGRPDIARWATALLVLVLSSCSIGDSAGDSGDDRAGSGTTPPTSAQAERLPCVPGVDRVRGPQAAGGAAAAMDAFCTVVDLTLDHSFTRLVLPGAARTPRDFAGVRPFLTDGARTRWDRAARAWIRSGDELAGRLLDGLVLHDVSEVPAGYRIDPDGAYAYGTVVLPPEPLAAGRGDAVQLTVTTETGLVLERRGDRSGRHSLLPVTRWGTYVLVPEGDRWLVDRWRVRFFYGDVRLVTGG